MTISFYLSNRFIPILFTLILVVSVNLSYAEESEITEKVVVTGIGVDIDKAKQNAIRNAVEKDLLVSDTPLLLC